MNKVQMNLSDYLFMQFKTMTPTLEQVAAMYYPHLSKAKILEKARKKEFPFICYKIDESQKSPYLVDLREFSIYLYRQSQISANDWRGLHE